MVQKIQNFPNFRNDIPRTLLQLNQIYFLKTNQVKPPNLSSCIDAKHSLKDRLPIRCYTSIQEKNFNVECCDDTDFCNNNRLLTLPQPGSEKIFFENFLINTF